MYLQVDPRAIPEEEEVNTKFSPDGARKLLLGGKSKKPPPVNMSFKMRRVHSQVVQLITSESQTRQASRQEDRRFEYYRVLRAAATSPIAFQ